MISIFAPCSDCPRTTISDLLQAGLSLPPVLFLRSSRGAQSSSCGAGPEAFTYPYRSRERFRDVRSYMPWDARAAGLQRGAGITRLYSYARNPLAHTFGVSYDPRKAAGEVPNQLQWSLGAAKRRLTMPKIHELEVSDVRPGFAGPPLQRTATRAKGEPERLVLHIDGLYWGIHRMLHALFADADKAARADDMAHRFLLASS